MTLEARFIKAMSDSSIALKAVPLLKTEIISFLDLTLLKENATQENLRQLASQAQRYQVAAICVLPQHLSAFANLEAIKRATVVNFPEGKQSTEEILYALKQIVEDKLAEEIDYVFPYGSYLAENRQAALAQSQIIYEYCKQNNLSLKVILETGALPSLEYIYQLSTEIINSGCDFLKTSTGTITPGATPAAAFAMLNAIEDSKKVCGLKIAGGIKTFEQALVYAGLAEQVLHIAIDKSWFRIGASTLLDELVSEDIAEL